MTFATKAAFVQPTVGLSLESSFATSTRRTRVSSKIPKEKKSTDRASRERERERVRGGVFHIIMFIIC